MTFDALTAIVLFITACNVLGIALVWGLCMAIDWLSRRPKPRLDERTATIAALLARMSDNTH